MPRTKVLCVDTNVAQNAALIAEMKTGLQSDIEVVDYSDVEDARKIIERESDRIAVLVIRIVPAPDVASLGFRAKDYGGLIDDGTERTKIHIIAVGNPKIIPESLKEICFSTINSRIYGTDSIIRSVRKAVEDVRREEAKETKLQQLRAAIKILPKT